MKKLLLHTCCAPCTTYVNKWLSENDFAVKGLFYNPNVRPQEEYERRLKALEEYANRVELEVFYEEIDLRPEVGNCEECLRLRLLKTAQFAEENAFPFFTTTLLVSPYQKHDLIKQIGEELGSEFGVGFFYQDFRVGYRESIQLSRGMHLYRQKYCGCGYEKATKSNRAYKANKIKGVKV